MTASPEPGLAVASSAAPARPAWAAAAWQEGRAFAARPEAVVTLFTALHLGMSFLNQIVLAYLFGVSGEMDAFLAAGALPLALTSLVVGELGFVLIPLLSRHRAEPGRLGELPSCMFSLLALGAAGVAFAGVLVSGWLLRLNAGSDMAPDTLALAASLAPWFWLLVGMSLLASFFTGLHHYHRRFALAALSLSLPYLGMIVGGLGWAGELGIHSVVYGWVGGALLKTVLLGATIRKPAGLGFRWEPRHPINREFWGLLFPLALSLLPFVMLPVVDVFWASGLPAGSLSALGYAQRIVIALALLAVQGIAVVGFPDLAAEAAGGRPEDFRRKVAQAVRTILLILLPAAVVVAALRGPLLELLFERGSFDQADTLAVARVLPWYLVGMFGMAPMNIISRAFFARRDYRNPACWGLAALIAYAVLCGLLIRPFAYLGIAVAYAVTWLLTFFSQAYVLSRATGGLFWPAKPRGASKS